VLNVFRKQIIDAGERPEHLQLTVERGRSWILAAVLQDVREVLQIIFMIRWQLFSAGRIW
jgi:hypothetical protein